MEGFMIVKVMVHLVPDLGEHDLPRHPTLAQWVVSTVVTSIFSLEEDLMWKFLRRKMMSG